MPFRVLQLSSPHNALLQEIRQALARGRPTKEGLYAAEGPHLLEELLRSEWRIERLVLTPDSYATWEKRIRHLDAEIVVTPSRTFDSVSATETAQGVLALARPVSWDWHEILKNSSLAVTLDGVQDPGNAGAIVRSAEAFRANVVIFLGESVRISNAKLVRAAAGSMFRIPICDAVTKQEFIGAAVGARLAVVALSPTGRTRIDQVDFRQRCCLIVGSEAHGVSPELLEISESITIPTDGVESLNAAIACSIALYEASRQRLR
jgi:RNA methyltransferase, TrmH family